MDAGWGQDSKFLGVQKLCSAHWYHFRCYRQAGNGQKLRREQLYGPSWEALTKEPRWRSHRLKATQRNQPIYKGAKTSLRHNSGPPRRTSWHTFSISKKVMFPEIILGILKGLYHQILKRDCVILVSLFCSVDCKKPRSETEIQSEVIFALFKYYPHPHLYA